MYRPYGIDAPPTYSAALICRVIEEDFRGTYEKSNATWPKAEIANERLLTPSKVAEWAISSGGSSQFYAWGVPPIREPVVLTSLFNGILDVLRADQDLQDLLAQSDTARVAADVAVAALPFAIQKTRERLTAEHEIEGTCPLCDRFHPS